MMCTHCPKAWLVSAVRENGLNTIHTPTGEGGVQLHVNSGECECEHVAKRELANAATAHGYSPRAPAMAVEHGQTRHVSPIDA